jgi:Flp pilus assembly protein TadD
VEWLQALLDDTARYLPVKPIAANLLAYWQKPPAMQPRFLRAALLERDNNWTELEALASQWARSDADDAEPWYLQGVALAQLDRPTDARMALERSLAIEPRSSDAWFRLGLIHAHQGQLERARAALDRLAALKSELAAQLGRVIERH